jgi:AAA+ ATPase superfamily predicted ATPase
VPTARRPHQLGALRSALDHPEPALIHVTGLRGVGKSSLVRDATEGTRTLVHRVLPLPEPRQRDALADQVERELGRFERKGPGASWDDILGRLVHEAEDAHPLAVVLDDAHRLTETRARIGPALARALVSARERGATLHVVLVGTAGALPDVSLPRHPASPPEIVPEPVVVHVPPLPLRAALPWLPGATPEDRIRAYAVFGGVPAHLRLLDPQATLETNARRLFLEAGAPLSDRGLDVLERDVQAPARYIAVLSSLATGEAHWGAVHRGVPDLTASGQVAPYLHRLEELGLLEIRRSLDAGPGSRSRRYRIVDPLVAFWFRFVLPFRHARPDPDVDDWISGVVRPSLDEHVATVFPEVCRQHMALDAMEWAGANAREVGSLWGPGYDVDVAGILTSGAAFYGRCLWGNAPADVDMLEALDTMVGETRYGFGRERRLRVVFSNGGDTAELARRAARRDDVVLVDGAALVGDGDPAGGRRGP